MSGINIARVIIRKRKEKGFTQEELANYMGVSSASVSKWETTQSYPDILLLPQLAAYFNITIDELMGYEPQLSTKDIGKLYAQMYSELSTKPIDEVIGRCRETIKKYFSCFPLLMQMGELLINASPLAGDEAKSAEFVEEAKSLFIRVKVESDDAELRKHALYMEALCASLQGNPNEVIDLLGKPRTNLSSHEVLLSSAYRMTGRDVEAETVMQVGIYQNIISVLSLLSMYAMLGVNDAVRFDDIIKRTLSIAEAFNINELQPGTIISFYVVAAQGYLGLGHTEDALDLLEQYTELIERGISWQIKGDGFFTLIDDWLNEARLDNSIAPHESISQGLAEVIINNPMFAVLSDNSRFQDVKKRLERLMSNQQ